MRKSKIEDLISEHTTRFLDTTINVEVSTGSIFRPMILKTSFFEPSTDHLLHQSILTAAEIDHSPRWTRLSSAPIGILQLSLSEVKKMCKQHIEDMVSNSKYVNLLDLTARLSFGGLTFISNKYLRIGANNL
jgi:hypothetical protein